MNANARNTEAIDITIDRALSALRNAQPRNGLENRILTSLEHRTATPQPGGFHLSAHIALWTATAAAIIAVASMTILHHHAVRAPQNAVILSANSNAVALSANSNAVILSGGRSPESKNPETARSTTISEPVPTTNLSRTTHTMSSRPERVARSGETCIPDHQGCSTQANIAATTPTDAQALADLHAPSHPAPPLPLTPQEKLFLRMLRYGNATQIAELNPIIRAKQDADETAAFKAFFPDPPPLQQSNGDTE